MNYIKQFSLADQVAIVTGACGGLGQVQVRILIDAGANVVLTDINQSDLQSLSSQLPSDKILIQSCNVIDINTIKNLIHVSHKKFKRIDILVNCAGGKCVSVKVITLPHKKMT